MKSDEAETKYFEKEPRFHQHLIFAPFEGR